MGYNLSDELFVGSLIVFIGLAAVIGFIELIAWAYKQYKSIYMGFDDE